MKPKTDLNNNNNNSWVTSSRVTVGGRRARSNASACKFTRTRAHHMIRYLHALKNWRDGQLNLAHGPETKKW